MYSVLFVLTVRVQTTNLIYHVKYPLEVKYTLRNDVVTTQKCYYKLH